MSLTLAILGGHSSIHTVRWANEMASRGHEVHLISMHPGSEPLARDVFLHNLPIGPPVGYYLNILRVRRLLRDIKPDLLNTHYATGYGILGRLSGFHPHLLSVWGSDVFVIPYESYLKRRIVVKNIAEADKVASTSWVMKAQTEVLKNPKRPIAVTPFGIDCAKFAPMENSPRDLLRIGTVKILHAKYGIDTLIEAFAIARGKGLTNAELVLVGDGPEMDNLKRLARQRAVSGFVQFPGWVAHSSVPTWLNSFDIYCALSRCDSESFGVAILEASACGVPVVVSDAGGLPEVVRDGETGCVVPRDDPVAAAERILELAHRPDLRSEMGQRGRRHVLKSYRWEECADRMEGLYRETIANYRSEQRLVAAS